LTLTLASMNNICEMGLASAEIVDNRLIKSEYHRQLLHSDLGCFSGCNLI
jgi:hypothetical protein